MIYSLWRKPNAVTLAIQNTDIATLSSISVKREGQARDNFIINQKEVQ